MKQGKGSTILLVVLLVAGFSLLLYPTVSDFWNSLHQSRAMVQYTDQVEQLDPAQCAQLWADAEAYNRTLLDNADRFVNAEQEGAAAAGLLTVSDVDVIGRLEIPSIDVSLPIYHGTSEAVLQAGVGNLEGSSLPTGRSTRSWWWNRMRWTLWPSTPARTIVPWSPVRRMASTPTACWCAATVSRPQRGRKLPPRTVRRSRRTPYRSIP